MNQRGLTIIELMFVTVLVFIVGSMSFFKVTELTLKRMRQEAKINLADFYRAQMHYKFEHNEFAEEINGMIFPKGVLRYNVGFKSSLTNPVAGVSSGINNYLEMCGSCDNCLEERKTIDSIKTYANCAFRTKDVKGEIVPPSIPNSGEVSSSGYKAFATANLFEDNHDVDGRDRDIDAWWIDEKQKLCLCKDPWGSPECPC